MMNNYKMGDACYQAGHVVALLSLGGQFESAEIMPIGTITFTEPYIRGEKDDHFSVCDQVVPHMAAAYAATKLLVEFDALARLNLRDRRIEDIFLSNFADEDFNFGSDSVDEFAPIHYLAYARASKLFETQEASIRAIAQYLFAKGKIGYDDALSIYNNN